MAAAKQQTRRRKAGKKKVARNKSRRPARDKQKPGILRRMLKASVIALLLAVTLSFLLVLPLRWFDPVTSAFMLQDDSGSPVRQEWADWDDIAPGPKLAVVAAEDQRFADHHGIDVAAIQQAVSEQSARGSLRGASTISQQTAKNLFLWSGRSLFRKGLEAWLTTVLEICLPKQRILEIYLNIAEFGPGVYGVGAAGREFFGRTPAGLRDDQAALLAAVLPNPVQLRVHQPSDYVRERQRWILGQMQRLRREAWLTRIE